MPSSATPSDASCLVDHGVRRFRPVGSEPGSAGVEVPVGHCHQEGDLVWAEFSRAVRIGELVGTRGPEEVTG
jgi:predicted P-loop ATPase